MVDAQNKGLVDATKLLSRFGSYSSNRKPVTISVTGDGVNLDYN